jgi:hypothetical protein
VQESFMSLLAPFRALSRKVREFDDDEEGMETIQVVMLLGLAAVVAVLIFAFWKDIKEWFNKQRDKFKSDAPNAE